MLHRPGASDLALQQLPESRNAEPALCTMARLGVVSPPTPTIPSLPTTAISAHEPSAMT
jgi:hypothetical protein